MPKDPAQGAATLTVFLCFVAALCEGFDVQAAGVAAAGLRHEFAPTAGELGRFFAASGAGLLVGAVMGGRVADRIGRKPVLVLSLLAFGCFSWLTCLAPTVSTLTATRLLTGLGLGGAMPNLIALAAEASSAQRRNAGVAVAYIGMPLGAVIASLVVFLVPLESWRTVFRVGAYAPLAVAALLWIYLPSGTAPMTSALPSPVPRDGMLRELFGERRLARTLALWAGFLLVVLTLYLMLNWLPLLLSGRGLGSGATALAQAAFNTGGAAAALGVGALLDSRWRGSAIAASAVALPLVLWAIAQLPAEPAIVVALALALGGAILAQQVILFAVANACYRSVARGTGVGAAVAAGRIGSLVGPLLGGALLGLGQTSSRVFIGLLPIVVACGACVVILGRAILNDRPS